MFIEHFFFPELFPFIKKNKVMVIFPSILQYMHYLLIRKIKTALYRLICYTKVSFQADLTAYQNILLANSCILVYIWNGIMIPL